MPMLAPATPVSYLGHAATVVHGYDPSDPWLPIPSQRRAPVVNIRFDVPAPGLSVSSTSPPPPYPPLAAPCGAPHTGRPAYPEGGSLVPYQPRHARPYPPSSTG